MTNTAGLTPDQAIEIRNSYRRDEAFMRADIAEVAKTYGIVEVGRFLPGGDGVYAGIEVLCDRGGVQRWVVHTAYRVDDYAEVEWTFYAGRYFISLRAALDYLER